MTIITIRGEKHYDEEPVELAELLEKAISNGDLKVEILPPEEKVYNFLGPEAIHDLYVSVPWDMLGGAAAGVVLDSIKDWIVARVADRRKHTDDEVDARLAGFMSGGSMTFGDMVEFKRLQERKKIVIGKRRGTSRG